MQDCSEFSKLGHIKIHTTNTHRPGLKQGCIIQVTFFLGQVKFCIGSCTLIMVSGPNQSNMFDSNDGSISPDSR